MIKLYIGCPINTPILVKRDKLFTDKKRFREEVTFASKNNFDCVRLNYNDEIIDDYLSEIRIAELKKLLNENNLFIENISCRGNKIHINLEIRKKWIKHLWDTVDVCRILDVKVVATWLGSPEGTWQIYGFPGLFGNPSYARNWDRKSPRTSKVDMAVEMYRTAITPIAEHAENQDVKIAFENNFRADGNIAHSPYIWDRMFKVLPSKAIGLRIDPSHFICLMIKPVDTVIRRYGDRIFAVDGKDCEIIPEMLQCQGIYGNLWWRYRIPGYGDLDWRKVTSALMDVGYEGGIIIENEDPILPGNRGTILGAKYLRTILH